MLHCCASGKTVEENVSASKLENVYKTYIFIEACNKSAFVIVTMQSKFSKQVTHPKKKLFRCRRTKSLFSNNDIYSLGAEEVRTSWLEHRLRVQRQRQGVRSAQPQPVLQGRHHPLGRPRLHHQ